MQQAPDTAMSPDTVTSPDAVTPPETATSPSTSGASSSAVDSPAWRRLETTLIDTTRLVREAFDCRFAPLSLNLTQGSILMYVADFGPVSQSQIADHLHQGRAATGSTIDRLCERGLVERHPDPDDRRVWRIHLTDDGRAVVERLARIDEVLRAELREGLSRTERQALTDVLRRLQQNLTAAIERSSEDDVAEAATSNVPPRHTGWSGLPGTGSTPASTR